MVFWPKLVDQVFPPTKVPLSTNTKTQATSTVVTLKANVTEVPDGTSGDIDLSTVPVNFRYSNLMLGTALSEQLRNEALRRVEEEVEQRPLLTLAIAAGIGFLAGMAGRRH